MHENKETQLKQVYLKYNPYAKKLELDFGNNIIINEKEEIYKYIKNDDAFIQDYQEELIRLIAEKVHEKSFEIIFKGRELDFFDFEALIEEYNNKNNKNIKCRFEKNENIDNIKNNLENLKAELNTDIGQGFKDIKIELDKILSGDLNLTVVSNISTGKSTLINALLGESILESTGCDCTKTIFNMKNSNGFNGVRVRPIYKDKEIHSCWQEFEKLNDIKENLKEYNKEEIATTLEKVEIEVDVKRINNIFENKIRIIDTPRSNNYTNKEHREIIKRLIKEDINNSLILYVLTPQSVESDFNQDLLSEISEQIKSNGINIKDRFVFILNRIDELDGEDIEGKIESIKTILLDYGIEKPKIFPTCAKAAELSQEKIVGEKMETEISNFKAKFIPSYYKNEKEKKIDDTFDEFDEFDDEIVKNNAILKLNLIKSSPLKYKEKIFLIKEADNYLKENQDQKALLTYAGVRSVEYYVNKFLEKYILPWKLKNSYEKISKDVFCLKEKFEIEMCQKEKINTDLENEIRELNKKLKDLKEFTNKRIEFDVLCENEKFKTELRRFLYCFIEDNEILNKNEMDMYDLEKVATKLKDSLNLNCKKYMENIIINSEKQFENYQLQYRKLVHSSLQGINNDTAEKIKFEMNINFEKDSKMEWHLLKSSMGIFISLLIPGGIFTTVIGSFFSMGFNKAKVRNPKEKLGEIMKPQIEKLIKAVEDEFKKLEKKFANTQKQSKEKLDNVIEEVKTEIEKKHKSKENILIELETFNEQLKSINNIKQNIDAIFK